VTTNLVNLRPRNWKTLGRGSQCCIYLGIYLGLLKSASCHPVYSMSTEQEHGSHLPASLLNSVSAASIKSASAIVL